MTRVKVLFVIDTLEVGGAERSLLEMIPFFVDIEAVVCHLYRGHALKAEYERLGVTTYSLDLPGPYNFMSGIRALRKLIRQEKPHLVNSTLLRSTLIGRVACRMEKTIHVSTIVSDSYGGHRTSSISVLRNVKLQFFRLLDKLTLRWSQGYIAISESVRDSYSKKMRTAREKIRVIYRGRNVEQYSGDRIASGTFSFIHVGRMVPSKGHHDIIQAAKLLHQRSSASFRLLLVGDGPERGNFERLVRELGIDSIVQFLGHRADVPDLLAQSNCFLFASYYEGMGGAVVEAMMAELPVIASDLPVFREFIVSEKTGLFFKAGNVEELFSRMNWAMTHQVEMDSMGKAAAAQARSRFDIRLISAENEKFYKEMIA